MPAMPRGERSLGAIPGGSLGTFMVETEEMLDSAEVAPEPTGSGAVVAQVMPSGPD